jgi:hypothetical protein
MVKRSISYVNGVLGGFGMCFPKVASSSAGTSWGKALKYGTVGAFAGITFSAVTVACKPKDTPDYLLPYYLRDCRSRFIHYASVKGDKGRRYMTPEDFLLALLASPKKK